MNINDFTQFFDNPKVSSFNRSHPVDFDLRISQFIPADWDLLSFGNSAKANTGHKMRLAPLLAPSFADLRFQEHAAIVPLRVIMEDYEQKFNYAENRDGASLPHFTAQQYFNIALNLLSMGYPLQGSLFDFFGFPVFTDVYDTVLPIIQDFQLVTSNNVVFNVFDMTAYAVQSEDVIMGLPGSYETSSYNFRGVNYAIKPGLLSLTQWATGIVFDVINEYYSSEGRLREFYARFGSNEDGSISTTFVPTIDQLVEFSNYETVDSLVNAYINYCFGWFLISYVDSLRSDPASSSAVYSTLPFRAYHRVFVDWLTNGNFADRDWLLNIKVYNFESQAIQVFEQPDPSTESQIKQLFYPANRLWDFDFFTSLLPSAAVDNSIEIPANSTVLDLAKLTALQKFVMKLSYSSRYRDVVWNIFKIKPSDARLQQSSIIHQKTHNVGIGEVLQTSETTPSAVLGSFAGRGYSSGRTKGYHIFCEEPCVLLDFVSLMPRAYFRDALHPLIHVDDILDFPIPDMDVLGNQPIYSDLVTGNPQDSQTVLGYGRQYQEWLSNYGTVHGQFKTTLDYWQLTRSFNEPAVINDDFLRMSDADDFDSIFSVPNAPHAMLSMYINRRVTRHVHRNVRIAI